MSRALNHLDGLAGRRPDGLAGVWALVLGFAISAVVQAWVPRERIGGGNFGATHPTEIGRTRPEARSLDEAS